MTDPLPFAQGVEVNDYRWTATAYDLMVGGKLVVTRRAPGRRVVATGECPRCRHDVDYAFLPKITRPRGGPGTLGRGPGASTGGDAGHGDDATGADHDGEAAAEYETLPILCQCGEEHPGRPKDGRGCGIVFNTELLMS